MLTEVTAVTGAPILAPLAMCRAWTAASIISPVSSGSGPGQPLEIALCAEAAPADRVALCAALDLADIGADAPEWVHLLRNDVMRTGEGRGPTLRPLPGIVNLSEDGPLLMRWTALLPPAV